MHEFDGGGEGAVLGRRIAVLPYGYAPRLGDFGSHFWTRQYAAVAWLSPLRQFDLYHLDAGQAGAAGKDFLGKISLFIAAAEIARADVPDKVALVFQMVAADAALAGVVGEVAQRRAFVKRQHRIGREGAKAHRRYVQRR